MSVTYDELSNEELLLKYSETHDNSIKQEIVLRYVYIVKNIAYKMKGVYLNFAQIDDIINEGVIAIMSSVDKFDPSKNVKFETFISKRMRGLIIDLARKNDWVPRNVRKTAKEIDEAVNVLFSRLGRFPTDEEISAYLGITIEKYREELGKSGLHNVLSLDMLLEDSEGGSKSGGFASESRDGMPEQHFQDMETEAMLRKALESLRENEQTVMSLYYRKELSMKEIAYVMQLSEPRISQIHANAVRKLKLYMEKNFNA